MRDFAKSAAIALALMASAPVLAVQPRPVPQSAPAQPETAPAPRPADPFGRDTPRGTVFGFLNAARAGDYTVAVQYLDTRLTGRAAEDLARQLFVVLDARLPPRLTQISDLPEGSRADPLAPDRESIGAISGASGDVQLFVQRVSRGSAGPLWYFAASSLEVIPRLHAETIADQNQKRVPRFLTGRTIAGLRLVDWLVLLLGVPLFFIAAATLNRLLIAAVRPLRKRFGGPDPAVLHNVLPIPVRLLLLALIGPWLLSWLPLSLFARQFWSSAGRIVTTVSIVWLLVLLTGQIESLIRRRMSYAGVSAATSLLRVVRRAVDSIIVFVGFLILLWQFGINPTPALAGLGVGGIAVALAAQKTLENLIAGASLVFDQAVRVGDFLRLGTIEGTVYSIGLRSTRIRTLDRTIVSVPNSQIANASLETLSARDMYWFHPEVRLRHDTTAPQLTAVLEGIRRLLHEHPSVDRSTIRVRFVRIGQFSFDIEVFAYVFARDWSHFLELQEALLFGVTGAVERAGTSLATPFQAAYLTGGERAPAVPPSVPAGAR